MIDAIRSIYSVPVIDINVKTHGKRTKYSELEVKQAMAMYKKCNCYGEVERQLGVSRNTVRLWASKYIHKNILNTDGIYSISKKKSVKGGSKLKPRERHAAIVAMLSDNRMSPTGISDSLGVSVVTVRKDLLDLLSEGKILDVSGNPKARLVIAA